MPDLPADLDRLLHDLRGPLNSAVMHLEVLKRTVGDHPTAKQTLSTLQHQLERIAAMLPAAVGVVALERRETRPVNLRRLVEQALEEHRLPGVALADGAWPDVLGDERLLILAIGHLVSNAVEATDAGDVGRPRPLVSTEATEDGQVALVVRDWGQGFRSLNPKVLIRLLATDKPGHHGIGLITVERIARLHGGTLLFESPGDGARVRLTLPAAR